MSKHETPLTRRYWREVGGTLIEELSIVRARKGAKSGRWIDAIILPRATRRIAKRGDAVEIDGQDVIVVQTKAKRLGMAVMGQAIFSIALVKRHYKPKSVRAVIVCTGHDEELEALLKPYKDIEVCVFRRKKPHLCQNE